MKHTILFLAADPSGLDRLALDREARAIQKELESAGYRDCFELETRWATEPLDLLRELRKLKPTVVHFSGHGGRGTAGGQLPGEEPYGLFFRGPDGRAQIVSTAALEETFGAAGASVKLVVLNACYTDAQAEALLAHVECVVGTSCSVPKEAARSFAIGFYGGLGERESIAAAYRQGCAAIHLEGLHEGDRPLLRVRSGVDASHASRIYLLNRPAMRRRCELRITAALLEFNADVILRVTNELREITGDLSLEIIEVNEGSVRLTISLSPDALKRLLQLREQGGLNKICGFEISAVLVLPEVRSKEASSTRAGVSRFQGRRIRRIAFGAVLSLLAAVGIIFYLRRTEPLDCESAARRGEPNDVIVLVCRDEYKRTGSPKAGLRLVAALRRSDPVTARATATDLLATEVRSDAFTLLGEIALTDGRLDNALDALQEARKLHRAENRRAALARDASGLAGVHASRDQFAEALYSLDECIVEAQAAAVAAIEGLCHVSAARALAQVGHFDQAREELARAERLASTDSERARLWLERGNVEQEVSRGRDRVTNEEQAVAAFEKALRYATGARRMDLVIPIELNLVFSLAELGRLGEAELHHRIAASLDRDRMYEGVLAELEARIAYRRGNLELASERNERRYEAMPPGDDRFEVCVMQTRIALALNDLAAAEKWARRGTDEVEKIRRSQLAVELRPWVLASRRAPYELLFTVLARRGRVEEAALVLDQWQGRALLDVMSRSRPDAAPGLAATASTLQSLGRWLPGASAAPLMSGGDRGVVEALRSIDLLALAVVEGEVWRVVARRGQIRIDQLGALASLASRLDHFKARPTDRALAGELGELLVPAELYRDTSTLYVVLDAPLADLPVVALRRGGQALIAARPVLRTPRLPTLGAACAGPGAARGAVVLADATGNLPAARRESEAIAQLLGTTAHVGGAATSTALFAAGPTPLLHVAVHADFDAGGGRLLLHDRSVSALEISVHKLWPPLVFLSAFEPASSEAPELAGSLSTAFLASGSSHVVATLRPISDPGALALTRQFYAEGGLSDPVRTLAAIQAKLADTDNKEWPSFAVFGAEVCAPKPKER